MTGKGSIKYLYDATGNKLKKTTREGALVTTTLYLMGNYVNDALQFIGTEEGRARIKDDNSAIVYDYMIKDHLGNVRMVLTEETRTDAYPAASMEDAQATIENTYYSNLDATRHERPLYTDTYTNPNDYAARLTGGVEKEDIGPAIALKVMAGDKFNLRVSSFWKDDDPPGTPVNLFGTLLESLITSLDNIPGGGHGYSAGQLAASNVLAPGVTNFLNNQTYTGSGPKAYVNWILFDEQFKYVASSSGFDQVGGGDMADQLKVHTFNNLPISKSGYLYIYVSNATDNINVYFDNLQVTHIRGPLVEETHYYPFGLTMAGISSKGLSFGGNENRHRFNDGTELNSDFGLNFYETKNRLYDPQIGRFWQVDEFSEIAEEWSPFVFGYNNPISLNDPLGLFSEEPAENGGKVKELQNVTVISTPRGHWAKQRLYYDIMSQLNSRGASIDQIVQPGLREMMYRYDGITKQRQKVAEMTRANDKVLVELGSWFIPTGWLFKVAKFKKLVALYKLKRGKSAVKVTEEAIEHGNEAQKLLNPAINITDDGLAHTLDRHTVNGAKKWVNKSKFNNPDEITDLIQQATQMPMVKQANGNFARVVDAGRDIGFDKISGKSTSVYTVITNSEGKLVTSFPGKPKGF